jgi:hypothetical protein
MGEKKQNLASVQASLPIDTIREGVVIMKDSSIRSVVMVSTLNFALKSDKEKESVIAGYQEFLNALEFPIQLLATSKKLDLTDYLTDIEGIKAKESNPLLKLQLEEYGSFIKALLEQANIMEKKFFVVVPYYGSTEDAALAGLPGFGPKKQTNAESALSASFETKRKVLSERTEQIIGGLGSLGLRCVALGTEDLLQLYYSVYNPSTSKNQKISADQDIDVAAVRKGTN